MTTFLNDYIRRRQQEVNKVIEDAYSGWKKGTSNDGTLKHIGEVYECHVANDPDLKEIWKTDSKKKQYYHLNRYWQRYPECKISPTK